jgi:outer membrane protein TolC
MQLSTALQRVEAAKQAAREDASHAARQSRSLRSALDAARAEASEAREALDAQRRAERSLARSLYSELEEQVILTMAVGRA